MYVSRSNQSVGKIIQERLAVTTNESRYGLY